MTLHHRILLPFDGSEPARAAASYARVIAARTGATVTLAYVLPGLDLLSDFGAGPEAARDATTFLAEEARNFTTPTHLALLDGEPAAALAKEAERIEAELVVLGARGRSPLAGLLLGSTARQLLSATTRPVLVAHTPVEAITHVLAGVEQGANAARVADATAGLAAATGAAVTLAHVVDADKDLVASPTRFGIPAEVWTDAIRTHSERVFGPLRPTLPGAREVIRYGRAEIELREAATADGAQVVVVARRGQSGRDVDAWFSVAFSLAVRGPFATLVV